MYIHSFISVHVQIRLILKGDGVLCRIDGCSHLHWSSRFRRTLVMLHGKNRYASGERKPDAERTAFTGRALGSDISAKLLFHQRFCDGKPQSCTLA